MLNKPLEKIFKIQGHQLCTAVITGSMAAAFLITSAINYESAAQRQETVAKQDVASDYATAKRCLILGTFFAGGTSLILSPLCRRRTTQNAKPAPVPAG